MSCDNPTHSDAMVIVQDLAGYWEHPEWAEDEWGFACPFCGAGGNWGTDRASIEHGQNCLPRRAHDLVTRAH